VPFCSEGRRTSLPSDLSGGIYTNRQSQPAVGIEKSFVFDFSNSGVLDGIHVPTAQKYRSPGRDEMSEANLGAALGKWLRSTKVPMGRRWAVKKPLLQSKSNGFFKAVFVPHPFSRSVTESPGFRRVQSFVSTQLSCFNKSRWLAQRIVRFWPY